MDWSGRADWGHSLSAGYVQLGDTMVPRKVTLTFSGEKGSPDFAMRFEMRDGRPECTEVHVTAKEHGRGIRTADLAMFNIDGMTVNAHTKFAQRPAGTTDAGHTVWADSWRASEDAWRSVQNDVLEARRRSRGTVSADELRRVAEVYREHAGSAPTHAVRIILGYSERTAARRVGQARAAGLLPPTTPGKRKA